MYDKDVFNKLKRLNFEDFIWVVFIVLAIINISSDYNEREYLITNDKNSKIKANKLFEITLIITFLIYIYFLLKNYNAYQKASSEEKSLYFIKLLGSSLLLAGILCLIYFQTKQNSFI